MKLIQLKFNDEEYKKVEGKIIELINREGKVLTPPVAVKIMVIEYINGSGKVPNTPNIEVSEKPHIDESIKPVIQEDNGGIEEAVGMFDGVNLDL